MRTWLEQLAGAAVAPILRRRAKTKFARARAGIDPRSRVLDIGAGEGFVGLEAARNGHTAVLVDVLSQNRTHLPHHVYDGLALPFDDQSFDVGLLCYVLHHCSDPDRVLRDSARVCKRLIVMESTFESRFDLRLLTFLDHAANRLRGIPVEPLQFDKVSGWTCRFQAMGLRVINERWLGRFVHKHVMFVLERLPADVSDDPGDSTDVTRDHDPDEGLRRAVSPTRDFNSLRWARASA